MFSLLSRYATKFVQEASRNLKQCQQKKVNLLSNASFDPDPGDIDNEFTDEETKHILHSINHGRPDDLAAIASLTPVKVKQIVQRRKIKAFEKLSEVKALKGFGEKRIKYLGQSILLGGEKKKRRDYKYYIDARKMKPVFMDNEKPESIISVCVNSHSFSWMHMDEDYCISEWEHHTLFGEDRVRFDHNTYQEKMWNVIKLFPDTNLYLMEEYVPLARNMMAVPSAINQTRIDTMVTTILNQLAMDDSSVMLQKVHKLKPTVLSNHFGLNIGGERVSSFNLVSDIYHGKHENVNVEIFADFINQYFAVKRPQQEVMASCLLQCVMFYDLLKQCDQDDDYEDSRENNEQINNTSKLKSKDVVR